MFHINHYTTPRRSRYKRLSQISNPSFTIFVADSAGDSSGNTRYVISNSGYAVSTRHSGGPNILFVDGHVKWYLKDETSGLDWAD